MDLRSVPSKTTKGLMEATGKSSLLSRDMRNLLKEVDGKQSVAQIGSQFGKLTEAKLIEAMKVLEREGFVREVGAPLKAPPRDWGLSAQFRDLDGDGFMDLVTINDGGWDHHAVLFNACAKRLPEWDKSVATLIQDLEERGMLGSTIVTALGEFGRTPKLSVLPGQTKAGRDHWANAMSVLIAGAGIPGGLVLGATDRNGYSAVDRVLSPENYVSTIYTKLGIDPDKILYTPQGRPSHLVSDPTPIRELFV